MLPLHHRPIRTAFFVSVRKVSAMKLISVPLRLEYSLNQLIKNQPLVKYTMSRTPDSPTRTRLSSKPSY